MQGTNIGGHQPRHAGDTAARHVWNAPPPGQGGRTQRVCSKCGQRMTVVGADSECRGLQPLHETRQTLHHYDPFSGDL
jgi:hypothetical protein